MMALALFLVALGAVLTIAITDTVSWVDLDAVGIILMAVGGVGFLWAVVLGMQVNGWPPKEKDYL